MQSKGTFETPYNLSLIRQAEVCLAAGGYTSAEHGY